MVGETYVRVSLLQVCECEVNCVVKFAVSSQLALLLHVLANLPESEDRSCRLWAEVDAEAVLFVFVPPAIELSVVWPLVISVAWALVGRELTRVLVPSHERQHADSVLVVLGPFSQVNPLDAQLKTPNPSILSAIHCPV